LIFFRILEPFADLYGTARWTAVPHEALDAGKGMKSWVATFYSTHRVPRPLKFSTLQELTGSTAMPSKFKFQFKTALEALKAPTVPKRVRVREYEFTDTHATVHLVRWQDE
jgi:hypothetical protein